MLPGAVDPYLLKIVETATKEVIDLFHDDSKKVLSEILNQLHTKGKEKARQNVENFTSILEADFNNKLSFGISEDEVIRITGSIEDPDFAFLLHQSTISASRTQDEGKHKLLAHLITERMFTKSESLASLTSIKVSEIIPLISSTHIKFLGLTNTILNMRPYLNEDVWTTLPDVEKKAFYIDWMKMTLNVFRPYPEIGNESIQHLEGLSCITVNHFTKREFEQVLKPKYIPGFVWPEKFFETENVFAELKPIFDKTMSFISLTLIGNLIGIYCLDILANRPPSKILWDIQE